MAADRPVRVLVVDDDFAVAELHCSFVRAHERFDPLPAVHTGAAALTAVRELVPDLVLLDIYLPDMSGLAVLGELRGGGYPPVDVIAITAARELETVRSAMAGGVLHYLVKPFTARALRDRLDDFLEHREALRRVEAYAASLDQHQVDQILAPVRSAAHAQELPKGLSVLTMTAVADVLSGSAGPLSSSDVADVVGMSRVAARRYLEHLVATGRADVQPRYGRSGRPENLYHWTSSFHG
jgi:two-component system CitB family response regulator